MCKYKIFIKSITYFIGLFFIGLSLWTAKFFGKVTFDQALSTVNFCFDGIFDADSIFLVRFFKWCILWPAIITLFFILFEFFIYPKFKFFLVKLFLIFNKCIIKNLQFVLLFTGICFFCYQYSVLDLITYSYGQGKDYFKSNYIDAGNISFQQNQPKSLVLIYVESLESTYSETQIFHRDLLLKLNNIENSISFKRYRQMPGTGWTIAGIISTQCGIPLKTLTIFSGNRMGENIKHYLPRAKCMSDILAENGYENIFMNGPSLKFAGVGKFLREHHYTELFGKEEWLSKGIKESEMNAWGLFDDYLFEQAKLKLADLIQKNKLFNLTILTIDTHGFYGQLSNLCKKQGYQDFEGIVECTGNQIADFVLYIKKKGWLDKLNVVILGDHLAMRNSVSEKLASSNQRYIFNMIISNKVLRKNTEEIVPFDMMPTILNSIGFNFTGNRIGLGYSGISSKILPPSNRLEEMQIELNYDSKIYNQLWSPNS